jgi:hypothetical protein
MKFKNNKKDDKEVNRQVVEVADNSHKDLREVIDQEKKREHGDNKTTWK